ncbi:M91 family zinc metallopeptidase [Nocardia huaxiensis]|uniref:M91 family zinc metallopeptidase n=1 Tax=Nocardia huaxiensis TaxID=2755382 RepID=UPI001E482DE7|nr:M91 family zinc metallopeptidase [Nocardia huaxiensis]UFS97354.1 hypothetical protein LPY97_05415 [Nocardia huaxiensis]
MPTLAEVERWRLSALADAGRRIGAQNQEFLANIGRMRGDIRAAQAHWEGQAYWAAYDRIGADYAAGFALAQEVGALAEAMIAGAVTLAGYRDVLLSRVGDARDAGFTVADDWTVSIAATANDGDRVVQQELIDLARAELVTATVEVDHTIAAARDAVRELGGRLGDDTAVLGDEPRVTVDFEKVTIETGAANDVVTVADDPATHAVTVTINGVAQTFTGEAAKNIVIKTHGGDDQITVAAGTVVGVKAEGGSGKDVMTGGRGRDYLDGGADDDVVIGGAGDDVLYGGAGHDILLGGDGNDYLEGGCGDDGIAGGGGDDILSGGLGGDVLRGDDGADRIYDRPVVDIVLQEIPDRIVVVGSPEFQERVRADLEFLNSSPTGQQLLASLGTGEHTVTITEGLTGQNSARNYSDGAYYDETTGMPGGGSDVTVTYDPRTVSFNERYSGQSWYETPPSVILGHELAHAIDATRGTLREDAYAGVDAVDNNTGDDNRQLPISNAERVAVGLPIDHDNNPATPEQLTPEHAPVLTENALRAELGLPRREHYDYD